MESVTLQPKSQLKNTKSNKGVKGTNSVKSTKKKLSVMGNKSTALNEEERNDHVAVSAYYKAQDRGFEPGDELADWLAAEAEIDNNMLLQ